mmetsp:Transcript_6308/g.15140  ORF Transcript_6308/g.15140 Transcript_6308/m.15140 type:complete len:264 (-) Transcript_6308:76-867(-)
MGGRLCCSDRECGGTLPQALDVLSPNQRNQSLFLDELQLHGIGTIGEVDEISWNPRSKPKSQGEGDSTSASTELRRQLLAASRQDDAPGVLLHIADGADIADMGEALRVAAHRGCASVARELVAVGLSVNECCPHTGFSPLQLAAAGGHLAVCELLLDALADVNQSLGGATALTLAHKMGHLDVEQILERHAACLGDNQDENRRCHVLPRVSPTLSEAVLQAFPTPATEEDGGQFESVLELPAGAQTPLKEQRGSEKEDTSPI